MKKIFQKINHSIINETTFVFKKNEFSYFMVCTISLLIIGIKVTYNLENTMDIAFADEAGYLRFGLDLFSKINRDWGPLYAVFYKFLSVFTTQPISLYYLCFKVTAIAVAILLFVMLYVRNVHFLIAFLASFFVLISTINITVWPRISHFCVIIILGFIIIISFQKNILKKGFLFALGCLLCSYARPEFYLAFILTTIFTLLLCYFNKISIKKNFVFLLFFASIVLVLHYIFRFPSNDFFGFNRSFAGFLQHYTFTYKIRYHLPWDASTMWEDLSKQQFPNCTKMSDVFLHHFDKVIAHVFFNLKLFFLVGIPTIVSFVLPTIFIQNNKIIFVLSYLFVFIIIGIFLFLYRKNKIIFSNNFFLISLLFIYCIPSTLASFLYMPRPHYLYLQLPFWVILCSLIINAISINNLIYKKYYAIFVLLICIFLAPTIHKYKFMSNGFNPDVKSNKLYSKNLVQYLTKNYSKNTHTIFTSMPLTYGMLPTNFKEINTIFDKKKEVLFSYYLTQNNIDIVVVSSHLLRDPHLINDTSWNTFITNPEKYNFKKVTLLDNYYTLLIKE